MIKTEKADGAPPPPGPVASHAKTLIDRQHLADFAMGDPALETRFLRLFMDHAAVDLHRLAGAAAHEFHAIVHSLKSSASSVGAWHLVDYAETVLEMGEAAIVAGRQQILGELTRRVEATVSHICQILGHD